MKIKRKRGAFQIFLNGVKIKSWFEKEIITTRKGETLPDQGEKPAMPDVNRVFAESLKHRPWLENNVYSLALPLLMHYAYNNDPKWWQPLFIIPVAYLVFWFATRDDKKVNRGSRDMPAPKKAKESTLAALARMEKEAREGREKDQQAYAEFEDENKVLTWNSTKQVKVPFEYLKDKNHVDYHEKHSYNFLANQRKFYDKNTWGYGEISNMMRKWSTCKEGWGTTDYHPHREDIKKLAFIDLDNWKELIKPKEAPTPFL